LQDDALLLSAEVLHRGIQLPAAAKASVNAHFGRHTHGRLGSRQLVQLQVLLEGQQQGAATARSRSKHSTRQGMAQGRAQHVWQYAAQHAAEHSMHGRTQHSTLQNTAGMAEHSTARCKTQHLW
jgi:hypothetical protein